MEKLFKIKETEGQTIVARYNQLATTISGILSLKEVEYQDVSRILKSLCKEAFECLLKLDTDGKFGSELNTILNSVDSVENSEQLAALIQDTEVFYQKIYYPELFD